MKAAPSTRESFRVGLRWALLGAITAIAVIGILLLTQERGGIPMGASRRGCSLRWFALR